MYEYIEVIEFGKCDHARKENCCAQFRVVKLYIYMMSKKRTYRQTVFLPSVVEITKSRERIKTKLKNIAGLLPFIFLLYLVDNYKTASFSYL